MSPRTAVLGTLGVTLPFGVVALLVGAGGQGHDHSTHSHAPAAKTASASMNGSMQPVGAALVERVPGTGRVRLEVAATGHAPLSAVPAGAAVRLKLTLPDGRLPRLRASSIPRGAGMQGASGVSVALQRESTVLVDRKRGQVLIPNQPGGEHEHDPGQGLAGTMPSGGLAAATTIPRGATGTAVDPGGRFLAAVYPSAGRVELVDLLLGRRAGTVRTGGRPATPTFAPDGRLWVTDAGTGRVTVVDPARARVVGTVAAAGTVAFGPHGTQAVVAGRKGAALVESGRLAVEATVALPAPAVGAGWSRATRAFVVGGADGTVTLVRPGDPRPERIGLGMKTRVFAVAPDGRRAVAAGRDGVMVVDLVRRRVLGPLAAGRNPGQVAFLAGFALVRDLGSPNLTWIDTETPSRTNVIALGSKPATSLAITPDGTRALLASPADQKVFGLHEMMGRPMLMQAEPNTASADAVLAAGGGLQRTGPRTAELRTVFARPGLHRIQVALGGRRAVFELPVSDSSTQRVRARPLARSYGAVVGRAIKVGFDVQGGELPDAQVLAYSTGTDAHQVRVPARRVAAGRYEAVLTAPTAGRYRVQIESERAGIGVRSGAGAVLDVRTGA
jgi:DNA-binding beta-propeller fold protein YncE